MDKIKIDVVVGGILEQDGKYLLVQEAKEKCRGKWNLPAGHVDPNETLTEAAKREIFEESGFEVEPTGFCQIGNRKDPNRIFVSVIFTTKIIGGEIKIDPAEILDVRWFTYEEIVAMQDQLRNVSLILGAIENVREGIVASLELISNYGE